MEREIPWFSVGKYYGGNQDLMRDPWMKLGGCAALAAVDSCLSLTRNQHLKKLCPIDAFAITEDSYVTFANVMKPYLRPRFSGVSRPELYTDGFAAYLHDRGASVPQAEILRMGVPLPTAETAVRAQIDAGIPVPVLHLRPQYPDVKEYEWHWFMLNGYREQDSTLFVKATTYGKYEWLPLEHLWNESDSTNGGLILYHL